VLSPFDSEDGGATDVYESRLAVPGTVSDSLEVSDPYDDVFGATVHVTGFEAGDELSYDGAIPGVVSGDTLTLTGRGTDADYQAALRAVTFRATAPGTRTVEYSVDNGSGPGPSARRTVVVNAPAGVEPPPVTESPPPPVAGAPSLSINDTGVWIAHLRPHRVFRVPGLVFYCPKAATASCKATVTVGSAAGGSVTVPPSETRGIRLRLSRRAARTVMRRGRLRLTARASYTLAGSDSVAAIKRFIILR
jgi:hypothetical protein